MSQTVLMQRRGFIGGSDARIIMGTDEAALVRLWREKRGASIGNGTNATPAGL
jgi:predicted phage-related endonuclease